MNKKICNHDCLNCIYDDCINDSVYSEKSLYRNRSEENKQHQREYQKKKRDEAREKGLCIVCRKRPRKYGSKCYECYIRQKRYDKNKYSGLKEYWKMNGLCYYCGGKVMDGKRVCEKHYKILSRNIAICNESENTKKAQKEFGRKPWRFMECAK